MLKEEQRARIQRIHNFYMEEPVFKHHVGYTRVLRQKLSYMRAWVNSVQPVKIGPAVTERNKKLLQETPYSVRLRRAMAEAAILNEMEPQIQEDELLVGRPDFTPLTQAEQEEYDKLELAMRGAPDTTLLTLGHMALDYPKLLRLGVNGILQEIHAYMDVLDLNDPENLSKYEFYEGCIIELESVITLQKKYAAKVKEILAKAKGKRKKELERMYDTLCRVPAEPAKTFYDALQAIHFYTFPLWELYYIGRVDQFLYPYYKADVEAGRLTYDEAVELLACFLLLPESYIHPGTAAGEVTVGGCDRQGNVVENEMTYIALDAAEIARSGNGKVELMANLGHSDKLFRRAIQVNATGAAQPAIFNDHTCTKGLIGMGVAPEDARYYANTGCTEVTPIGSSGIYPVAPYHNVTKMLVAVMREHTDAQSVDVLLDAFGKRLHQEIFDAQLHINRRQMERSRVGGEPLRSSCLIDDCLRLGKAIDEGGARYNQVMPTFVGISNVADSFTAIDTLVFKEKKLTLAEFLDILDNNYEGHEALRQYIINRIPHYGINDPLPDGFVKRVTSLIVEACKGVATYRHSILSPGTFTYIENVTLGRDTQATPDGRKAGTPLAASSAATAGYETKGPTAAMLSATGWDHTPFVGGIVINVKFTPGQMSGEHEDDMLEFIKAFLKRGGWEMQFNCVSNETLKDAQKNPEAHRDLLVRVSGFSCYFTKLHPDVQQEIIERNEQAFE